MDIDYSDLPQRGGKPSDKENFVLLLKALRERFDKERLILSVTVDPNEATAKVLYDVEGISKYVNFINLMTFDFHGNSDKDKKVGVGHSSPMYYSPMENSEERKRNIVSYFNGRHNFLISQVGRKQGTCRAKFKFYGSKSMRRLIFLDRE